MSNLLLPMSDVVDSVVPVAYASVAVVAAMVRARIDGLSVRAQNQACLSLPAPDSAGSAPPMPPLVVTVAAAG